MRKPELKYRSMVLDKKPSKTGRQTYEISFSSEYPVKLRDGRVEILSHDDGCCDLNRLQNGVLPLLFNHDHNQIIGKVLTGGIDPITRKGRATIVFSDTPEAQLRQQQFEEDVLVNVSFGYSVHEFIERGNEIFATLWEPYEISLVSTPADPNVGKNRIQKKGVKTMPTASRRTAEQIEDAFQEGLSDLQQSESLRVREITKLGRKYRSSHGDRATALAEKLIDNETPLHHARSAFLDLQDEPSPIAASYGDPVSSYQRGFLDMSRKEIGQYSLLNAINSLAGRQPLTGLERECHEELAKRGFETRGTLIPMEALKTRAPAVTSIPSYAGSLVQTEIHDESFVDALRNRMVMAKLGVTMMNGLQGNVAIPRQNGVSALGWISENTDLPESNPTFDLVNLTPKTVGAWTTMSRQVLTQSSMDLEMLIRQDFAAQLAVQLDQTMIHGTGTANQPRGILNTAGISSVAIGANGGPVAYSSVLDLEAALANKNADTGSMGWLTSPKLRKSLKNTLVAASAGSEFIWQDSSMGNGMGSILGYQAMATTSVRSDLTKGTGTNLSALIFGNWSGFVMGSWGALSLETDQFADFRKGTLAVRILMFADMALRNPESFAVISDATTP